MYDECQEVEARVPVEICKRRRFDEDTIFLSRGEAMRRAGEPKVAAAPYRPSDSQQTCQLLVPTSEFIDSECTKSKINGKFSVCKQ